MITNISSIDQASQEMGEKNDCAVIAVALAVNAPYMEIHALFKRYGRKDKAMTSAFIVEAVLEEYNKCMVTVLLNDINYQCLTDDLPERLPVDRVFFVVTCNQRHVVAALNGKVYDDYCPSPVDLLYEILER